MPDPKRTQLKVRAERAFLVHVSLPNDPYGQDDPLSELRNLTGTAGARVMGELTQNRGRVHPTRYLGKGKLDELKAECKQQEVDVVICDDDLSPSQMRNMEEGLDTKVVDRSELILDIFAQHAQTAQAQLAIELAQLEYTLPRLKQMWTHLDRTAGGTLGGPVGGGIGVRGPGEKQLEVDRRLVERRIHELRRELKEIEARCLRMVLKRKELFPTVSLVGYTNAGKSSLMNALTHSGLKVQDRLFVTLDTRTRTWALADSREVLLSDTVGFIRKLPHHLVASFQATLEEARHADLLLHVVDASHPLVLQQVRAVDGVLKDIGCGNMEQLLILNKIDLLQDYSIIPLIRNEFGDCLTVSAVTGEGLDKLDAAVAAFLNRRQLKFDVEAAASNGRLVSFLYEHGVVLDKEYRDDRVYLQVRLSESLLHSVADMGGVVTARESPHSPAS